MVCANVFGLEGSQGLRAMMDVPSLSPYKLDGLESDLYRYQVSRAWERPKAILSSASRPGRNCLPGEARVVLGGNSENGSAIAFILARDRPSDAYQLVS